MKIRFLLLALLAALPLSVVAAQDATAEATAVTVAQPDATAEATAEATAQASDWTPETQTVNGIEMVQVPAGTFTMGTSDADVDALFADCEEAVGAEGCQYEWFSRESPQSDVTIEGDFWISRTEVTNAQYAECAAAGACTPLSDTTAYDDPAYADYPVVYVTWEQANQFADWFGGRLPNEAEWEYAARGAAGVVYPWGDEFDPSRLNFCDTTCPREWRHFDADDGYPEMAPVGSYPNESWVGAVDMSGNAAEWTLTQYHEQMYLYPYDPSDGRNDRVTERLDARIVRGGSWLNVPRDTRTATRSAIPAPQDGTNEIGFRVVADKAS